MTGTIDGNELLQNLPGCPTGVVSKLGGSLSDIKVSLFIPRDSHLVETALIDMTMHVAKQSMHMNALLRRDERESSRSPSHR